VVLLEKVGAQRLGDPRTVGVAAPWPCLRFRSDGQPYDGATVGLQARFGGGRRGGCRDAL